MTPVAVILLAVWLIVHSQAATSSTFSLLIGIAAGVLALADLLGARLPGR